MTFESPEHPVDSSEMTEKMLEAAAEEDSSYGPPAATLSHGGNRELPHVESGRLFLTSGAVVVAKRMPPTRLLRAVHRFPRPTPPTVFHEQLQREIENPDDPDYKDRLKDHKSRMAEALLNVMLIYGVDIVDTTNVEYQIGDTGWVERIRATGQGVDPENEWWRKLNYFHDVLAPLDVDHKLIQQEVGRLNGIRQDDAEAAANFPGSETD